MDNMFNKWRQGLEKTSKATFGRIATVLGATEIDDETWEDLEAILVQADLGVETTEDIVNSMRERVEEEGVIRTSDVYKTLRRELLQRLDPVPPLDLDSHHPAIVLLVGVNGSGKTTTAAK